MWVRLDENGAPVEALTLTDIKLRWPDISFSEGHLKPNPDEAYRLGLIDLLGGSDIHPLTTTNPPTASLIERVVPADPIFADGEWVQQWAVDPLPLEQAKAVLWASAKTYRDHRIDAGVSVPGIGTFDSDLNSRLNITGAVTLAQVAIAAGQPFTMSWKLADNSIEVLDASEMIAVGVATGQYVGACHAAAQAVGLAINAAEDHEALAAIDIEAGYP